MIKNRSDSSAHDRLLAAANELFYREGVNNVGIERVIEHAGVAKASLYNAFGSKDELVRAYLSARHAARKERVAKRLAGCATARDRLLAIFELLAETVAEPTFRGCAFVNASAEIAGVKAREVCGESRAWLRGVLVELARDVGVADPEHVGRQLNVLYDGALVGAQMDRDPTIARDAKDMAASLIDAAQMRAR
jgi:AcrR family transcriptional regulator